MVKALPVSHALSQSIKTFCLIFGVVEALGAILWSLAGAGIYGSPLAYQRGSELAHIVAFLLAGPLSALVAAILILCRPGWGVAWFIAGGLASGVLAIPYLSTDAHILPLALVSLPMIVVGLWLIRVSARTSGFGPDARHPVESGERQGSRGQLILIFVGVLLFLVALVGTYTLIIILMIQNVTGLRGEILPYNPFFHENQDLADGVVVSLVAAFVGLVTLVKKRLKLRGEAVAGMWLAVLFGGVIILIR